VARPDILRGAVPRKPCGRETGSGPEAAMPSDSPLWVMLELKLGKVLALVDIGAQFSCVRSDVAEYLYLSGELCDFVVFCVLFISRRDTV